MTRRKIDGTCGNVGQIDVSGIDSHRQYVGASRGEVLQAFQVLGGVFGRDERGPGRMVERAVSGAENQR